MNVAHLNKERFCPNSFFHPKKTFSKEKKNKDFSNEKKDFCACLKEPTLCLKKNSYTYPKKRDQKIFHVQRKNFSCMSGKSKFYKRK